MGTHTDSSGTAARLAIHVTKTVHGNACGVSDQHSVAQSCGSGSSISDINTAFDNLSNQTLVVNHYVGTSVLNRPANGTGVVWTFRDVAAYGWQVAIQNGVVYTRYLENGTLLEWKKLAFS